jgi:DNA-binding NarL/FixJ family response regulator
MEQAIHPLPTAAPAALRVFLVEDSSMVRDLITDSLAGIPGVVVAGFSDTEKDALEKLSLQIFDVVIFDIELKQGNGMSLLRTLAKAPAQPNTLKIIFSNNVTANYRRMGEQYGVRFFFDKTSEFLQLCALLTELGAGTIQNQPT